MLHFKNLLDSFDRSNDKKTRILDIGGEARFWENVDFDISNYHITVVNFYTQESPRKEITSIIGNALNLSQISADSVDVVFSNSVIEHVGSWNDQVSMAEQLLQLESPIFLQTPNFWFPMEPHFLFPFFQFLLARIRALLLFTFNLGGYDRAESWKDALNEVRMVRLLSKKELRKLFPGGTIEVERVARLASGLLVSHGWPDNSPTYLSSLSKK